MIVPVAQLVEQDSILERMHVQIKHTALNALLLFWMKLLTNSAFLKHAPHLRTPVEMAGAKGGNHRGFLSNLLHWTSSDTSSQTSTDSVLQQRTQN